MTEIILLLYVSHVMQRFMQSVVIITEVKNIVYIAMISDPGAVKILNASRSRGTAWGLACEKCEIKRVIKGGCT